MEGHGECEIKVQLNCSHCETQNCKRDDDSHLVVCLCDNEVLASDNVTCVSALSKYDDGCHGLAGPDLNMELFRG